MHPVDTGTVAGGAIVGGRCTPRPKARRSLSYGTPQSTKKGLSLKVYIRVEKWRVYCVVCT